MVRRCGSVEMLDAFVPGAKGERSVQGERAYRHVVGDRGAEIDKD
jgi:hypothetical protein